MEAGVFAWVVVVVVKRRVSKMLVREEVEVVHVVLEQWRQLEPGRKKTWEKEWELL